MISVVPVLARRMFYRRCDLDGFDRDDAEREWVTDEGIRNFWMDEADHVLEVLREQGVLT